MTQTKRQGIILATAIAVSLIVLVILKLTGTINLSWWLVCAPVGFPAVIVAGFFVAFAWTAPDD